MTTFGKFLIRAALALGFVGALGSSYAQDISYLLNIPPQGDLTVAGTITTDGTIGPLTLADIVSYNFSETSTSIPYTAQFNPSDSNFSFYGLVANASGIYIKSTADGGGWLFSEVTGGPGQYSAVNPLVLPGNDIGHYGNCTVSCLENGVSYTSVAGQIIDGGAGAGVPQPLSAYGSLLGFPFNVNPYSGNTPTCIASNGAGCQGTKDNPVLPTEKCLALSYFLGCWKFTDVISRDWADPVTASGYTYQMTNGSLFTEIVDFPTGFLEPLDVTAPGCSIPGTFGPGQSVDFVTLCGSGVSEFTVTGIDPMFDPTDPGAFPIQLAFNTPTADFIAEPLGSAVPEPSTWAMILLGFAGVGFAVHRRTVRNGAAAPLVA
jgi:hypothetical protein